MHYYKMEIGEYRRKTMHLSLLEHGIYRQLLDQYYLQESPFKDDQKAICRSVCARTTKEKKLVFEILNEFFSLINGEWIHKKCQEEIEKYQEKSEKAKGSANARWCKRNANASKTHTERNANSLTHKLTNSLTHKKDRGFTPPTLEQVSEYCLQRKNGIDPEKFIAYYEASNWYRGKNKIKNWKSCVITWEKNHDSSRQTGSNPKLSSAQQSEAAIDSVFGEPENVIDGNFERVD